MKSWTRHFILGLAIGLVTVIAVRYVLSSIPGYEEDGNLLVTLFVLLTYGVGTAVLGELLLKLGRKKELFDHRESAHRTAVPGNYA